MNNSKFQNASLVTVTLAVALSYANVANAQPLLPKEQALWPTGAENSIHYADGEQVRSPNPSPSAPSGSNRVFSSVSEPTYSIHRPEKANGVGLVICPGGGYTDVWLDREGHDLAIWLKRHGITSLVLKYRTNGKGTTDGRKYSWETFMPFVVADARQAIRVLRSRADDLKLDRRKIGIGGFSAGGNLATQIAVFNADKQQGQADGNADFAGLFYPWLRSDHYKTVDLKNLPPMFIMNAVDDRVTPADRCIEFYSRLLKAGAKPELHLVSKGGHGFDLGETAGKSAPLWKPSFIAWMKDTGLIE